MVAKEARRNPVFQAKMGIMDFLCHVVHVVKALCYTVKFLDLICLFTEFVSDAVIGAVKRSKVRSQ